MWLFNRKLKIEKLKQRRDVTGLIRSLKHEDVAVRGAVVRALGDIGDACSVESLIYALKYEAEYVRSEAAIALGELGDEKAVEPLIQAWGECIAKQGPFTGIFVLGKALGKIGDRRAVEPLIRSLTKEWYVREAAAIALGDIGDERAIEPLTKALKDDVSSVRIVAKEALDKIVANNTRHSSQAASTNLKRSPKMKSIDQLEKKELRELLNKCWMTHDAMWFQNCLQECGIEKTNEINLAAMKAMAAIEIKRVQKALGIEKVETFEELRELFEGAVGILKGDFIKLTYDFPSENLLRWDWIGQECFAYNGIKSMGIIDKYQCGVIYRIECWLDSLGVKYVVTPEVKGCLMHTNGNCSGEFRFFFANK